MAPTDAAIVISAKQATVLAGRGPATPVGERETSFGYDGLGRALRRRAPTRRHQRFHPHKLRHTAAHRWLAHGGSESGLMAIAGWTRTDMLQSDFQRSCEGSRGGRLHITTTRSTAISSYTTSMDSSAATASTGLTEFVKGVRGWR